MPLTSICLKVKLIFERSRELNKLICTVMIDYIMRRFKLYLLPFSLPLTCGRGHISRCCSLHRWNLHCVILVRRRKHFLGDLNVSVTAKGPFRFNQGISEQIEFRVFTLKVLSYNLWTLMLWVWIMTILQLTLTSLPHLQAKLETKWSGLKTWKIIQRTWS